MTEHLSEQKQPNPSAALKKIQKAAARIADSLTDADTEECLRVVREAKKATHRIFDQTLRRMIEVPDHKTRLAAVMLSLAYDEGLPIQKKIQVVQEFRSADDILERFRQSPEAMRMLRTLADLDSAGEIIAAGDPEGVQKTGS